MTKTKKVLIFGTFDTLHKGHEYLLLHAKALGDSLSVVLSPDVVVAKLKGSFPSQTFIKRKQALIDSGLVNEVIEGDEELGRYSCIELSNPDIVAFGYDQKELQTNFRNWLEHKKIELDIKVLKAYHPEKYKTSILRKNI